MRAERYTPACRREWDEFVDASTNATFLHRRDYMEYHADRFTDASLMVRDDGGALVALFPANAEGTTVCSHRGLTYGGLLVGARHHDTASHLEAWQAILDALRAEGFTELIYKPVPYIYCSYPSDDDLYALFRCGARLDVCQPSSAIRLDRPLLYNHGMRQAVKRAARSGVTVGETDDFAPFWSLLEEVLMEHHGVRPVHTLAEMERLRSLFPGKIRLFTARDAEGSLIGGTVIYFMRHVAHSQYIAISQQGRRLYALPALTDHIVGRCCEGLDWFDFGTSCEDAGRVLNATLNAQKYGMGGRPAAYTAWRLTL